MTQSIRFCLVLHNHQPVGNFNHVFEQAYQESYLPFLNVFETFESLKLSLHTSGPLVEWLDENHPEYLDRIAQLVTDGRIEIIGGAYYEPILTMIPSRDRIGQITSYRAWLESRLGGKVRGLWVPERVWEQGLASDLAKSDVEYTLLDDFHFQNAGVEELHGYYNTEDDGHVLSIFPGSERLRYLIPFRPVHEAIDHLRWLAQQHPNSVAVFGDDGEKFGTWPDTQAHVYQEGWLRDLFEALVHEQEWLHTATLGEAYDTTSPLGKTFLPDGSYREMTEWALPVSQQLKYDHVVHELQEHPHWERIQRFMRGGFWRNFKVKYPESAEMYARMMNVSDLLLQAEQEGRQGPELEAARTELYRGQCNCSYWHGAFGGLYLPHLRNAIYGHLIRAENLLEAITETDSNIVEATADDYNFDGQQEVRLANDKLIAWFEPAVGGRMYELDLRSIEHNLLATMARRPEAYHEKVRAGQSDSSSDCSSIHDRIVFKQEGLEHCLQYDQDLRKSLVDHFFDNDISMESVARGEAMERGDFAQGSYTARVRRGANKTQVQLQRIGNAWGIPLTLTKGITLSAGSNELEIAYLIEGLPQHETLHFAVELNFAGMPAGADDRYFRDAQGQRLGELGQWLNLEGVEQLDLVDEWLGLDVSWSVNQPSHVWTFPIASVSQSEGGFEMVHQSVVAMPHWWISGDAQGRWSCIMKLDLATPRHSSPLSSTSEQAQVV